MNACDIICLRPGVLFCVIPEVCGRLKFGVGECGSLKGQILSLPSLGGGKDMVIVFARSKSDAIAKADGTYEVILSINPPSLSCRHRLICATRSSYHDQ